MIPTRTGRRRETSLARSSIHLWQRGADASHDSVREGVGRRRCSVAGLNLFIRRADQVRRQVFRVLVARYDATLRNAVTLADFDMKASSYCHIIMKQPDGPTALP
jgi:hypothetical protein